MGDEYYDYQRELRRLRRHRETFINNIEVAKILPGLCESDAFTKRDETEVMLDPRRRFRAEKLLDMVERRGPLALEAFQEAIEENYPHLYVLITDWDDETEAGDVDMYPPVERYAGEWAQVRQSRDYLIREIDASKVAPHMHFRSLLTDEEMNDILSQDTVEEKNDIFLDLMETRNPGAYKVFLEVLSEVYPHIYLFLTGKSQQADDRVTYGEWQRGDAPYLALAFNDFQMPSPDRREAPAYYRRRRKKTCVIS